MRRCVWRIAAWGFLMLATAFLAYRDDFEFAPAAREVVQAFDALRAEHEGPAKAALDEARAAFQQGRRDEGYANTRRSWTSITPPRRTAT